MESRKLVITNGSAYLKQDMSKITSNINEAKNFKLLGQAKTALKNLNPKLKEKFAKCKLKNNTKPPEPYIFDLQIRKPVVEDITAISGFVITNGRFYLKDNGKSTTTKIDEAKIYPTLDEARNKTLSETVVKKFINISNEIPYILNLVSNEKIEIKRTIIDATKELTGFIITSGKFYIAPADTINSDITKAKLFDSLDEAIMSLKTLSATIKTKFIELDNREPYVFNLDTQSKEDIFIITNGSQYLDDNMKLIALIKDARKFPTLVAAEACFDAMSREMKQNLYIYDRIKQSKHFWDGFEDKSTFTNHLSIPYADYSMDDGFEDMSDLEEMNIKTKPYNEAFQQVDNKEVKYPKDQKPPNPAKIIPNYDNSFLDKAYWEDSIWDDEDIWEESTKEENNRVISSKIGFINNNENNKKEVIKIDETCEREYSIMLIEGLANFENRLSSVQNKMKKEEQKIGDYHHLLELYDIPDADLLKIVKEMRDVNRKRREYKDAYINLQYVKKILSTGLDKAGQRPMHPDKRRYVPRALPKKMFDQYDKVNQPEPEIIMLDRA